MDSLMDTLTNVVGILMIILILIQLNVSQAIVKIISDIPPIDVEQFEELELDAQAAAARVEEREQQLREVTENRAELTTVRRELADLQAQLQEQDAELLAIETLLEQRRRARESLEQMREEVQQLLAERNRLQQLLAEPMDEPPPATVVSLPSARPVPDRATLETFLLSGGQLFYVDLDPVEQAVMAEINRNLSEFELERRRTDGGDTVLVLDQEKVSAHFAGLELTVGHFQVEVPGNPTGTRLQMRVSPIEGAGMEIDGRLASPYVRQLRDWRGTNKVVWFNVAPDSFEHYTRARDIADQEGLPVGWQPVGEARASRQLNAFQVNRLREPTPQPPDPDAIRIPPPRQSLD